MQSRSHGRNALRVAVVSSLLHEGAGRVGCAVGRSSGQLVRLTCCACPHAPRERPFFPARVLWSCCDSPGVRAARGLSSKPCAGAVVQGFVTEPPWTLRFLSPEAMPSEFASPRNQHGSAAPSEVEGWAAGPRSSRNWLPRRARICPDALTATPAAALSSRSFGRPRNLPPKGRMHYAGGFQPCEKVRFYFRGFSLNALSWR